MVLSFLYADFRKDWTDFYHFLMSRHPRNRLVTLANPPFQTEGRAGHHRDSQKIRDLVNRRFQGETEPP